MQGGGTERLNWAFTRFDAAWFRNHRILLGLVALNVLTAGTGFAKDLLLASLLGTGLLADAYAASFFIVDTFGTSIFGNAVGVVTTARLSEIGTSHPRFASLTRGFTGVSLAIAGILALLLLGLKSPLLHTLSTLPEEISAMNQVYWWLLPEVLVFCVYAAVGGALQSMGRFFISVGGPIVINLAVVVVVCSVRAHGRLSASGLQDIAAATSVGATVAMLAVIARYGYPRRQGSTSLDVDSTKIDLSVSSAYNQFTKNLLVYVCYLGFLQGIGLIERIAAARLGVGDIAALTYAYRVAQVPNWIFVSAVGVLTLPRLAHASGKGSRTEMERTVSQAISLCLVFCLPAALVFFCLRGPLVQVLFERGAFAGSSVHMTATFLGGYAIALVTQALALLLFRLSMARGNQGRLVLIAGAGCSINAAFDWWMTPILGPYAIGLGALAGSVCSVLILWRYVPRHLSMKLQVPKAGRWRFLAGNGVVLLLCIALRRGYALAVPGWKLPVLALGCAGLTVVYAVILTQKQRR